MCMCLAFTQWLERYVSLFRVDLACKEGHTSGQQFFTGPDDTISEDAVPAATAVAAMATAAKNQQPLLLLLTDSHYCFWLSAAAANAFKHKLLLPLQLRLLMSATAATASIVSTSCCYCFASNLGEEELWSLGSRLRSRFPELLEHDYYPRRYPIISTQVNLGTKHLCSGLGQVRNNPGVVSLGK